MHFYRSDITFALLTSFFLVLLSAGTPESKPIFSFSFFAGPQYGGINEDKNVDGVTSASKFGGKTGLRAELEAKKFVIVETGLEYIFFNQELSYLDPSQNYDGKRALFLRELRIPLTYNLHVRENRQHDPLFILRLGGFLGILLDDNTKQNGTVPEYSTKRAEGGIVIGGVVCPFTIAGHVSVGFCLDMQRGFSTFWNDPYQKGEWMGAGRTSSVTIGVQLRFCNF